MKTNLSHISGMFLLGAACLLGAGSLTSCTDGFDSANRPGNKIDGEEINRDNYAVGAFLIQLQNEAYPEQENTYQMNQDLIGNYLGRFMTYANNGFAGKNFALFNAPNGWVRYPFADSTPKVVSAFKEVERISGGEGINYAWALILRAQSFQRLTDMYGPFPIGAEEDANAYSSQETVYHSLIADLNKAISILKPLVAADPKLTVNEETDHVYGGKFANWLKYANSLKLRMAVRMRYADPTFAKQCAEEAVADGVITDNSENLCITYTPNGQYKTSVEWGDSRACADIETFMNGYKDPRITAYFKPSATKGDREIIGCLAGANIGNKNTADAIYSAANVSSNTRGVWMSASEVTFLRAEGALAGWNGMGGTVGELYNKAVELSFEQWGVSGADKYLADDTSKQADYVDAEGGYGKSMSHVSEITIKWDDNATAEQKLERLMTQKWIALFPDGQEAWSEIRRTGYPEVFETAQSNGSGLKVPNRIPFDNEEIVNNATNYTKAVQLLGGADNYETKMWWQKKK